MRKQQVRLKRNKHPDLAKITQNACEYARLAYEQEEKREESLINQATQMTTYFSFVSVLVLMIIPIVTGERALVSAKYTVVVSIITLALLFSSMFLAVVVQWRRKYRSLSSPLTMFNHIMENKAYFETAEQRNKSFVESLDMTWASKRRNNNWRAELLKISMTIFLFAIAFLMFATVFAIIAFVI